MNTFDILISAILRVGSSVSASPIPPQFTDERPARVADAALDTVWALIDASSEADDDDAEKEFLREAESHARNAVQGHEGDIERRYALAAVLGLRANVEGGRTKVQAASGLMDELDVILETDPNHVGARHMLGRLHAGVRRMGRFTRWIATNLLGGDELKKATWEAAEEHLAFAEEHAPEVADHHLQLALLFRDTGRPELAELEIDHVIELPATNARELAVQAEAMEVWFELGS